MKVIFSERARRDLRAIAAWISKDRPLAAQKVVLGLRVACAMLAKQPHAYQFVEGRENEGVRRAPYSRYLVLYRAEASHISVVRILDGARDITNLL
ncbi:type II toxin-antitoxin system RelE/ParE family toxin [Caulobacter segnis]